MSSNQDSLGEIAVQRRSHLTKDQRIPKCLKEVEKIIKSVKSCKQNYKTVLANSKLRGRNFKKVYSMTVNVLKNYNYIEKIMTKVQLLEKEKFLRKEIASVLIYELLFGSGILPGESKVVTLLKSYENDIRSAHEVFQNNFEDSVTFEKNIPRYARVHTLVTTVAYVIKDLENYGFKQIFYDENLLEDKYLELVQNLERGTFLVDFHFKDILVFEPRENLVSLELYKNGHIFLQDKASYIPVHVLNPEPSSAVLDACAAPGMKTLHIASKMKNKGILIACERDKSRFESLKQMLEYGSVKTCKMLCKDFKHIDPNDQAYSVDYILLDPSCSGSGMVNRMDEVTDTEDSKNKERLRKLAGFQIILLKHALRFPSVKRVVYSTCSVHEEENEYVVHEALGSCNGKFKLVSAMPEWSYRGSEDYTFGKLCLRTVPEKHLTNGFFVAVFERVDSDEEYTGRRFSKKHKSQVDGSDNFPDEMNSGFEKEDSSEIGNESHEYYHKSKYSKRRESGYNMQQSSYENYNQNMTDETEHVSLNCLQEKSKNLDEFSHSFNEIKPEQSINRFSEQPLEYFTQKDYKDISHSKIENDRHDVSVKSKKHKHKKIDNTSESVEIAENQFNTVSPIKKLQTEHNIYHESTEIFPNTLNEDIEINSSQNMIHHENFEYQQKKKKKHKKNKNKEKSYGCSIEFNTVKSKSSSGMLSESLQKCSQLKDSESISLAEIENNGIDDSVSEEKVKLFNGENAQISVDSPSCKKKKKKHSFSIETNFRIPIATSDTSNEICNEKPYATDAEKQEKFDYVQKKKQKENKSVVSLESLKVQYETKNKNYFYAKENLPLCKTKKVKHAKEKEIYSLETQTAEFPNDSAIECIGSIENVPVKKKKHKKNSKTINDVYEDSSVSVNDSGLFSQSSEKSTGNSNNDFQALEQAKALFQNENTSHKHGKKKKRKYSDKNSNDILMANAPESNSVADDIPVVFDNELSLTPDDNITVHKRHKRKKHKV